MKKTYDLIIVGAGPAGLTAAIYCVRYNLKTLVIGEIVGGQMTEVNLIENYPGVPNVSGIELGQKMLQQSQDLGAEWLGDSIETITKTQTEFKVTTASGKEFVTKSLLVTSGTEPKRLEVPGEKALRGHGVCYCVTCDGPLYRGKTVAVVGGGDAAMTGVIELMGYAAKVYVINRSPKFRAKPSFLEMARKNPRVTFIENTNITAINGEKSLASITLDKPFAKDKELSLNGLFVEIGSQPATRLTQQLDLTRDDYNYIEVGPDQSTNVAGVYAAGDITTGSNRVRQIVTATAEGAIAAKSIYQYLQEQTMKHSQAPQAIASATVTVNSKKCVGCGICVTLAPGTFEVRPDGLSYVKVPAGDDLKKIRQAAAACPDGAITLSS